MVATETFDAKVAYTLVDAAAISKMSSSSKLTDERSSDDGIDLVSKYSIPLYSSSPNKKTRGAAAAAADDDTVELTTLEQWYEFYAVRYPSRGYLERQEQLLQLEQEKQRQNELLDREKRMQQGGWLRRFFFGGGGGNDHIVTDDRKQENQNNDKYSGLDDFIDDNNEDDEQSVNFNHEDGMCGTTSPLDTHAITKEALAFHRFHLVSERRALCTKDNLEQTNRWRVVLPIRSCVGMDDDAAENEKRATYCIVGYGKIAEFPPLPSSSSVPEQINSGAKVTLTSDRDALCQFVKDKNHDSLCDLRHSRAALIGPDCLAVSWGRGDGFIVLYRRVQQQGAANKPGSKKEKILEVGWKAVAVIAPTDAVANEGLKNVTPSPYASGDNEQRDEIASLFESGPLRVTDLTPLVVKNDSNIDRDHSMSAILTISRLGGYIELVPIPNQIWSRYARPPTPPLNQLPNLTGMVQVTAISTAHHHVDIMALDAYRTSSGSDSAWNGERDREGAAAEIILASCGRSADTEVETEVLGGGGKTIVTLWGITTIHSPVSGHEDPTFIVSVSEINSISVGQLGADSTVFCPGIASVHWTKDVSGIPTNISRKKKIVPCSITTKAPFTSLCFSPRKSDASFLAALDYNGGVTVIESTNAVAFAEHRHNQVESDPSTPLLSILSDRENSLLTATRTSRDATFTSQIEWWCSPKATHLACFSVTRKYRKSKAAVMKSIIRLYSFESGAGMSGDTITIPVRNIIASNIGLNGGTVMLSAFHHPLSETLSFVRFSQSKQTTTLSICGVRTILDPSQIITSLLERSDPEKALFVARRFGGAENFGGNVMNECRMKLWEDQMDVTALRLISDDKYVINEALNLIRRNTHEYKTTLGDVHLDTLLEVYREGLDRCERTLPTEPGVDKDWLSETSSQLRNTILSFGTFKLLLNHFRKESIREDGSTDAFSQRFLNFQRVNVFDIAECAAANGDIAALTIIFARHRLPLRERMIILDRIPLSVDVALFRHLLPCYGDGDSIEGRFLPTTRPQVFMTSLEFFSHLADAQLHGQTTCEGNVDVFTDDIDREYIVESLGSNDKSNLDGSRQVSKDDVAAWYLKRAMNLHRETGQIAHLTNACEMGLIRLGLASSNCDGGYESLDVHLHNVNEVYGKLYYLHLAAQLLGHVSEDKLRELLSSRTNPVQNLSSAGALFRSVFQFCSMGISDTASYMSLRDHIFSRSMFDEHVKSFIDNDQYFDPGSVSATPNSHVFSHTVRSDALKMCIRQITSVRKNDVDFRKRKLMEDVDESLAVACQLENALSACLYFASLGISTPSAGRVIRHDKDLVDFAEQVFRSIIMVVKDDWDLITDSLLQNMWSLLELLPCSDFLSDQVKQSQVEDGNGIIVLLYFKLVALQLCCKWCRREALPRTLKTFFRSQLNRETDETVSDYKQRISSAGYDLVVFVCGSFSVQVGRDCDENLLFDFISDIEELDRRFFTGTIQSSGSLGKLLFPTLLRRHSFGALRRILTLQRKWFDEDYVCGVIRSFVVDRMSLDSFIYGMEAASVGLTCMKILGPFFPELRGVFEQQHRLFDAKKFTSDTLKLNNDVIHKVFDASHSNESLVVIECLIQECPQSLLMGCEFWGDNDSFGQACVDALQYFSFQIGTAMSGKSIINSAPRELPPMPGGLVMRLANILGINTPFNTLLVKKIMLMGALRMSLVHAAVAICYSMLADAAFAEDYTDRHKSELLGCINAILLDQAFTDSYIRKDLCIQSLKVLPMTSLSSFDTLFETFFNLEYESLLNREQNISEGVHGASNDSHFLLFRAVERVAKQARDLTAINGQNVSSFAAKSKNVFANGGLSCLFHEIKESTSTDLLQLLSSFHEGVAPTKSNLEVISRTVLSWITSVALTEKKSATGSSSTLTGYNIIVMTELVSCCLNELHNDSALAIINRAVEAFESAVQQCSSSTNTQIQPDQAIVERLNGRGYGLNASRRAAIMTRNQGYSKALSWAVSHFHDDDFDSPLYFLQVENAPQRIEQSLVQSIKKLLDGIQASLSGPMNDQPTFTDLMVDFDGDSNGNCPSHEDFTGLATIAQPLNASFSSLKANGNLSDNTNENSPGHEKVCSKSNAAHHLTTVRASFETTNTVGVDDSSIAQKKEAQIESHTPEETISSVEGSMGSRSSIQKQVSRGGTTLGTQKLSLDERKKLALEGKRLLDLARAKNKKVSAPPSTITTTKQDLT